MSGIPNRRPCVTERIPGTRFAVTVGFHPDKRAKDLCGRPVEVFLTMRGKSGTELEETLFDLGVTISRLMQHKHREEDAE